MPALFIYLIKANVALTLFYLAYRFGLRRLTFYTLNRYFLLIGIAFSATFPLVDVAAFFQQHEQLAGSVTYYAVDWNSLQHYMTQQDPFTIWNMLQYVFWTGVVVMAIRFIIQLISLLRIHLQATSGRISNEKIKLIPGKINPFSFFKNIYINPSLHSSEELKTILAHEKIHIRQWHTLDVLAGEMNTIFYWFNPGAWLMKNAIRENLEFITDRKLLQSGINAKSYQYSLLKTVRAFHNTPLANNFNFSNLKQRIRMMNKKRSSGFHLFRYLLLLPVIAVVALVVTSSRGQSTRTKSHVSASPDTAEILKNEKRFGVDTTYSSMLDKRPEDYKAFLKRNPSVKSLRWVIIPKEKGQSLKGYIPKGGKMKVSNGKVAGVKVFMKNGETEYYDLNNKKEIKAAEKKYGDFPKPLYFILTPSDLFKDTVNPYKEENSFSKEYKSFLKRNPSVISLSRVFTKDNKAQAIWVTSKKGPIEIYHLDNQREMKAAEAKYGKFPSPLLPTPIKPKVKYTPPKVVEDTTLSLREDTTISPQDKDDNYFAKKGLQALKEKKYLLAKTYAKAALKKNPDNHLAKQELTYIQQMKDYQKKREEYKEKQGKDEAPKVKVQFTPPKVQTHTISNGNKPYSVTTFNKVYTIPTAMFVDTVPDDSHVATLNRELDKALLIIDNKIRTVDDAVTNSAYLKENFNPEDLNAISILKGQSAIEKYGQKAKDGAIEIYTKNFVKKHPKWHPDTSAITAESKAGIIIDDRPIKGNPIYIVDGHVADSAFINQLKGKDIRSISVLKGTKAVSVYGKKAKDGAIIITTKEYAKKHSK